MKKQDALMSLFNCTEDDLVANRQGRLSARQIKAVSRRAFTMKLGLVLMPLAFYEARSHVTKITEDL